MEKRKICVTDDLETNSSDEQKKVENMISKYYYSYRTKQKEFFQTFLFLIFFKTNKNEIVENRPYKLYKSCTR
jgi:hypothetical protein